MLGKPPVDILQQILRLHTFPVPDHPAKIGRSGCIAIGWIHRPTLPKAGGKFKSQLGLSPDCNGRTPGFPPASAKYALGLTISARILR
jgi:hypothetical protein